MAFMGRGDIPSINNGDMGDNNLNENGQVFHRGPFFYRRFYYYIPLDNTYVIMQMIVTLIILVVGVISFITTYKSTIIDPIENIKKVFINVHLTVLAVFLVMTFIINYLSKDETTLIKRLIIFSIISIITMIVFFCIKINFDETYTKEKFETFFYEQDVDHKSSRNDTSKQKIAIGITGLSIKTEQEYYVDECLKLYGIFQTKTYSILALHLLLNILLIYQVFKVANLQGKKDKVNKDDAILFDEEQNVRF